MLQVFQGHGALNFPSGHEMASDELERLLAPFRAIGAHVSIRSRTDGSPFVHGIQCRDRAADDQHVALLPSFPELHAMGLEGTQVTDAALPHLTALVRLESLDLDRTSISDAGLLHLANLAQLEFLHIEQTLVTHDGVRQLQFRLPKCEIVSDWT